MKNTLVTLLLLLSTASLCSANAPQAAPQDEAEATPATPEAAPIDTARRAQILSNLRFQIPQLDELSVAFESLEPSGFEGLDIGMLVIQGQQRQAFVISEDNTQFYFLAQGPIDLSRSVEELEVELAARREAEEKAKIERLADLDRLSSDLPFRGDADAKVTIIEFSDFQCPYCSRAADTVHQILEKYETGVKVVYMHLPLVSIHPWAKGASIASVCAADQGSQAFWTLHDGFFEHQKTTSASNMIENGATWLAQSGIDVDAWKTCSSDTTHESYQSASARVDEQMALAQKLGLTGTPAFYVNGEFLNGAQPLQNFVPIIDGILAAE